MMIPLLRSLVALGTIVLLVGCSGNRADSPFARPEPRTIAVWNATDATLAHFSIAETFTSGVSSPSRRSNPGSNLSSRVGTISGAASRSVVYFPRGEDAPPLPDRVRVDWQVGAGPRRSTEVSLRQVTAESTGAPDEVLVFAIDRGSGLRVRLADRADLPAR